MDKKYLIVKGCAGLGNRLITLSNAIEYAKKTNRIIYVDWRDGQFAQKYENAFHRYFKLEGVKQINSIENISITPENSYPKVWGKHYDKSVYELYQYNYIPIFKVIKRITPNTRLKRLSYGYWKIVQKKKCNFWMDLFNPNNISKGQYYKNNIPKNVVFFADFCPNYKPETFLNHIKLKKSVEDEINSINSMLNLKNKIGIHVRMTDKQPISSLKKFIIKLQNTYPNKGIFLASDNNSIKDFFKENFNEVQWNSSELPVHKKGNGGIHQIGIQTGNYEMTNKLTLEAIHDMWLLSKCEILYQQSNSTFSEISTVIRNNKHNTYKW